MENKLTATKYMRALTVFFIAIITLPVIAMETDIEHEQNIDFRTVNKSRCEGIVAQYKQNHNSEIQRKLRAAYQNDACFEKIAHTLRTPLSDVNIGPITKTWINQYMSDYTEKTCAPDDTLCIQARAYGQNNSRSRLKAEQGLQPWMLTEEDISYFAMNSDVVTTLKAMNKKSYTTKSALLAVVKTELGMLEGMTPGLLAIYIRQLSEYVVSVKQKIITRNTLDILIINDYLDMAAALQGYLDRPINETQFNELIKGVLRGAYQSVKPQVAVGEGAITPGQEAANIPATPTVGQQRSRIKKATDIINLTATLENQYQINSYLLVEKAFPTIDSDITACVKNLANSAFHGKSAAEDTIKSMLRKIARLQAGDKVDKFSCEPENKPGDKDQPEVQGKTTRIYKDGNESLDNEPYDKDALKHLMNRVNKSFYSTDLEPVQLSSLEEPCGECSLPMKGTNYGFYPYWQASVAYKELGLPVVNPAVVDFSVFSRIAYFALPIAADGKIEHKLHWKNTANIEDFVRSLKRYNVKRDLVLYSNSWQAWGAGKGESDTKQLVYGYAENHLAQIQELHESVKEAGGLSGITLFFEDYKSSSDANNIINYITHLHEQIKKNESNSASPHFDINIVLDIDWNYKSGNYCHVGNVDKAGETYFKEFENLLVNGDENNIVPNNIKEIASNFKANVKDGVERSLNIVSQSNKESIVTNLLVFLHEPSSRAKKCLRLQIEDEFHGGRRIEILRKVIPVLGRADLKENTDKFQQFEDDINYLKDNFGGIGLWPLPMSSAARPVVSEQGSQKEENQKEDADKVISVMQQSIKREYTQAYKNYIDYSTLGVIGEILHQPVLTRYFSVCSVMCPGRGWVIYVFVLLFSISTVSFIAYRVSCKARKFIVRVKWIDIALKIATVITAFIVLGCDPGWQPISNEILLLAIVLMIIYAVYRGFFCGYEKEGDE